MKLAPSIAKSMPTVYSALILSLLLTFAEAPAKADVCGAIAGNLVANCGFETGSFSSWSLSGNLQGGPPPNSFYGVDSSNPNSGSYEAYLGVQGGGGAAVGTLGPFLALTQSLNLVAGGSYQLSFALAQNAPTNAPGYVNHFDAMFGGTTVFTETNAPNSGGYQTFNFTVTAASSGSTLLQFDFQNDSDVYYFDDVVVKAASAIPEPASAALLCLPVASLLMWKTKRRA